MWHAAWTAIDWRIVFLGALAILLVGLGATLVHRRRHHPAERERRRRMAVHRNGRLGEAVVTDADEHTLHYSYSVGGVTYSAAQDVTSLRELLPPNPGAVIGHASLKYTPGNPANSIVICEEWSGLRPARSKDDATVSEP